MRSDADLQSGGLDPLYCLGEYSDVAGKGWRTTALFLRDTGRYDVVTISEWEQERPLSDMVKPFPAE